MLEQASPEFLSEIKNAVQARKTVASAMSAEGPPGELRVIAVLERFLRGVKYSRIRLPTGTASLLLVDKKLFERDIDEAVLGELGALPLLLPYHVLSNPEYLLEMETRLKTRAIVESLESLVLEYSYLSSEILIEPSYFVYDSILRRTRVNPLLNFVVRPFLQSTAWEQHLRTARDGYLAALRQLAENGTVELEDNFVKTTNSFVETILGRKFPVSGVIRTLERAAWTRLVKTFADTFNPVEITRDLLRPTWMNKPSKSLEIKTLDPKRFLTVPTSIGFLSLSNQTTIEEFVESSIAFGKKCLEVRKIGGALNNVYLLKFDEGGREHKAVAKKFEEWANFKWLALAAWSIGTQNFSVRAKTRLARECSSIQSLKRWKFPVPDILHVSWEKSLLILQFIEGTSLDKLLIEASASPEALDRAVKNLGSIGELLARVHARGFTLGDFKPENVIVDSNGEHHIVDLEQAGRNGNESWDVGEFVYYSAHLASAALARRAAKETVRSFLEGYLDAGGARRHISRITLPDYLKVFAPIVLPPLLYDVTRTCANVLNRK